MNGEGFEGTRTIHASGGLHVAYIEPGGMGLDRERRVRYANGSLILLSVVRWAALAREWMQGS